MHPSEPPDSNARRDPSLGEPSLHEPSLHERFRGGDEDAFRELLDTHMERLRSHLTARLPASVRRRVSVADVIQETCLVAFDRRQDFETGETDRFGPWLRGIAENKLRYAIRRHAGTSKRAAGREITRGGRPDTQFFAGGRPSPSRVAMSAEEVAGVRAAMEELPEDYRQVLHLSLQEGLSLRDAGERMDRSREATKKLYGRALQRLRQILDRSSDGR